MVPVEIWKDVVGYEGKYQVSSFGRVKALAYGARGKDYGKEKKLKPEVMKLGYLRVPFWDPNKQSKNKNRRWLVHRLVGEAFGIIPSREYTKGVEINHIDGNKKNNSISNLEAVNRSTNIKHAFVMGKLKPMRGEKNPTCKYKNSTVLKIIKMTAKGKTRKQISEQLSVPIDFIKSVRSGRRKPL